MTAIALQDIRQVDGQALRAAFGCFPSGVIAVCAMRDGRPDGMAASAFTSVSLDPALVSVCVQKTSATWPRLRASPRLGLSVLSSGHEAACLSLARKEGDRFAGVEWETSSRGAVFVSGASAWLDCVVEDELTAGDHLVVLLRIQQLQSTPEISPLVFHGSRFHSLASSASSGAGT